MTPTVGELPESGARPCGAAAAITSLHRAPPPTRATRRPASTATALIGFGLQQQPAVGDPHGAVARRLHRDRQVVLAREAQRGADVARVGRLDDQRRVGIEPALPRQARRLVARSPRPRTPCRRSHPGPHSRPRSHKSCVRGFHPRAAHHRRAPTTRPAGEPQSRGTATRTVSEPRRARCPSSPAWRARRAGAPRRSGARTAARARRGRRTRRRPRWGTACRRRRSGGTGAAPR